MKKVLLTAGLGLFLLGCSVNSPNIQSEPQVSTLKNSVWVLSGINGKKMQLAIMEGEVIGEAAIVFGEDIMSGNTGVNQFKAQYKTQNNTLITSQIASTMVATFHKILAENERDILSILNAVSKTYKINNDTLEIFSNNGTLLYKRFSPLAHSSWSLVKLNDKPLDNNGLSKTPFLEFAKDTVSGFLGNSAFSADFQILQNILKFTNIQKDLLVKKVDTTEAINLEKSFTQIISSSPNLELPLPTMLILSSKEGNLTFLKANFLKFLNNSHWGLEDMSGEEINGIRPTLEFKNGNIFGSGGVNMFNGKFALAGRKIYIDRLASTKMAGSPNDMALEHKYLRALENAEYFEISNDSRLVIVSQDVKLTFVLK